jgi:hypothetical protein
VAGMVQTSLTLILWCSSPALIGCGRHDRGYGKSRMSTASP